MINQIPAHSYYFSPESYAMLAIPLCMWISAQLIKFILYSAKHGLDWKYLFEYGHMPSSHTSCITSLIVTIGYYQGVSSPIFAVTLIIGLLTIYDAVKLRSYIGEYGKTLNKMVRETGRTKRYPKLKERVGHTLTEALSGAALGMIGSVMLIMLFQTF